MPTPYISVVVAARNDNHGGDMLRRMQAFVRSWIEQAQSYDLASEIVVVEWNPPADRPKLQDALAWPRSSLCPIRFIEVPQEIHQSIPNAAAIPLHQMIAKNAGILRARGEFVLCTNLDIIFSAELMQYLAARSLDRQAFYRLDRYDIEKNVPADADMRELLAFCNSQITRVSAREGTYATNGDNLRPVEKEDIVAPDSGLRLGHGWFSVEQYPNSPVLRYIEPHGEIAFERQAGGKRQIVLDVEIGPSARHERIDLDVMDAAGDVHDSAVVDGRCTVRLTLPEGTPSGRFGLRVRNGGIAMLQDTRMLDLRVFSIAWSNGATPANGWKLEVIERGPGVDRTGDCPRPSPQAEHMRNPVYLHTNGCGDFTMLTRDAWCALRGYPEFPVWPTHIDAFLCYAAYHAGYREAVLTDPMRIFHIEHQAVWTPETEEERAERAAARGVSLVGYQELMRFFHHMRRFNVPVIFAGARWGLTGVELPEAVL